MKVIVITQDSASRINPVNGEVIEAFRPSVVSVTEFVTALVMKRVLKPTGGPLKDTATDEEFAQFYLDSDKNVDLAVSSFMSKFLLDNEEEIPPSFLNSVKSSYEAEREDQGTAAKAAQDAANSLAIQEQQKADAEAAKTAKEKADADNAASTAKVAADEAAKSASAAAAKTGAK